MAEISSYPKIQPKAQDLLLGSRTYVAGVDEFTGNPTSVFTVGAIADLVSAEAGGVSGTVGKIPIFTTATTVGDSIITQNTNGYVGIGINMPSQKLHVDGSARVTGGYYDSSNSQGTSGQVLSSTGSGTTWVTPTSGGTGTVTSVDLSTDIGAFIVAANPITSAGTITLNLNGGTAGQFLRQDGNWADIPGGNAGTVTSVSGTGTVSGLTLTGTVTSSGDLTLGGTLALTSANVTTGLGFTPYNATNPAGYTAFAEPGIFSGGGTPTLATGVTALEVRTLIGAGTSSLTLGTTSSTALAGNTNTITAAQATAIDNSVKNNTDTYAPSAKITQIVTLSQTQYDTIAGGPLASTLYIIL
jgi:hypothetical protein